MLKSLTVTNFALIEQVSVDFSEGLNILTGETGAGKSILIDALNIILGSRASVDFIRAGSDHFRIEALFEIDKASALFSLLEQTGIEPEEDGTVIISRRLTRNGKNTILINGCHTTLNILKQVGDQLVDMHGQHENQTLLHPGAHLFLLDRADDTLKGPLQLYRETYRLWQELSKNLSSMESMSREREQRTDMLKWQIQEIAAAQLTAGEEQELEQKIHVLANAEKISAAVNKSYTLLSQGYKGLGGILSALSEVKKEIEFVARYDRTLEVRANSIRDMLYQLEEDAGELRDYSENLEFDPTHLTVLQERMDLIHRLKKKYGDSIDDILVFHEKAQQELTEIVNYADHLQKLLQNKLEMETKLRIYAYELDQARRKTAAELARNIRLHLLELGMSAAQFMIDVKSTEEFLPHGSNEVLFLFSANVGEPVRPLHKIASGGELSRIALAIKTVCASRDEVGIMVFDEVDAGIGGKTAQMVAEKIAQVALVKQVLCITHLPQIACMADAHIYIEKKSSTEKTATVVRKLGFEEQLSELARMIAGNDVTRLSLENAAQMLENAKLKKEKWKKRV
jgi:DNA repair protein RecN (Recombination protein N)